MAETPPLEDLRCLSPIAWVQREMKQAKEKFGLEDHNPFAWFAILAEEFGEVAKVVADTIFKKTDQKEFWRQLEYELIQTAAMALAFVEAIRRERGTERLPICVCRQCFTPDAAKIVTEVLIQKD